MIEELEKGPVLDAALIAGGQKAEHYEIASYGTLAYYAEMMDHDEAKELLGETLDEEKAADEKLNAIAKSRVNAQALRGAGQEEDEDEGFSVPGMIRRAGLIGSLANDRGPSRRSAGRKTTRRRSTARKATKKR
jgi:hypothetical protein